MKNILTTLMLIFSLSLFSNVSAQSDSTSTESTRVCYNSTVKVKTFDKEDKENKEGKLKHRDNCFEVAPESITLIDHKDKVYVFEIQSYEIMMTKSGLVYVLNTKMDGEDWQLLVHGNAEYIAVHDPDTNRIDWYFMNFE